MRKNSLLKVATFALCGVLAIGSVTASAKVKVKNDANNGDWSAKKVTILDTSEADLMVRVGDIDCLNEECEDVINAYNPFKKGSEFSHCWFWNADEKDPEGTDSIYVGEKASKNKKYWMDMQMILEHGRKQIRMMSIIKQAHLLREHSRLHLTTRML